MNLCGCFKIFLWKYKHVINLTARPSLLILELVYQNHEFFLEGISILDKIWEA